MSLSFLGGVVITYVDFPLGMLNENYMVKQVKDFSSPFNVLCIIFILCVTCLVNKPLQYNTKHFFLILNSNPNKISAYVKKKNISSTKTDCFQAHLLYPDVRDPGDLVLRVVQPSQVLRADDEGLDHLEPEPELELDRKRMRKRSRCQHHYHDPKTDLVTIATIN